MNGSDTFICPDERNVFAGEVMEGSSNFCKVFGKGPLVANGTKELVDFLDGWELFIIIADASNFTGVDGEFAVAYMKAKEVHFWLFENALLRL